ncbi:MAG TPA: HlyD family efflux transporter periplasmic adaptor subunit [Xanthomonadales bacterium]|nr:HlyD family efflux transporter periplasmic adaptor subunit [Xanthomonadales bacterium]
MLLWLVVAAIVAVGLLLSFRPQAIPVDLVTVHLEPMVVTIAEEGKTQVHDMYVLSAPVAGQVMRINAHVGDPVQAGETVLARIEPGDPSLLDPRSEAQAQAALRTAESALALAQAEVDQATAELEFAQSEWRRANELVSNGTISQRDYDNASRALKAQQAALATTRASLQMRLFELDQAKAQLLSPLQTQQPLQDCECLPITAPVSGRVFKVFNASERVVAAGEPLLEIGDPMDLEISVDFLSSDAVKIRPGQSVIIAGWGGSEPLEGRVRLVEPFGFTKVSALGIEEQRVNVIIDFTGPVELRTALGHGYQVEARVILWSSDNALTVPLTALYRVGSQWSVMLERNGRAVQQEVVLGHRNATAAEILQGLEAGDRVVAYLSDRVQPGVRITQRQAD